VLVAKSSTGKWVSRVGSAGGGKAYRKSRPMNYYGVLGIIMVLGLSSIVYSRYEYQHPTTTTVATAVEPTVGTTYYAALNMDVCGQTPASFVPTPSSVGSSMTVSATNIVKIEPLSPDQAGLRSTLALFAEQYPSLTLNSSRFSVPNSATKYVSVVPLATHTAGELCPAGSKYAGQKAYPVVAYWDTLATVVPVTTTTLSSVHFGMNKMRVTFGFEPKGVTPPAPSTATLQAMLAAASGATTTTAG